jgi:hypothetical protein
MENTLIAHLQADIARLNRLLEAVIIQNAETKADIAYLKNVYSSAIDSIANTKTSEGKETDFVANIKSSVGNETNSFANIKIHHGNETNSIANAKTNLGKETDSFANTKIQEGNTTHFIALPETISDQSDIKNKLQQLLISQKVAGSNRLAIAASVEVIIHIYNKKPCDYKSLKRITVLSQFGLAKRIRAMKKAGFIVSSGFQSFSLTNYTLQLLQKVVGDK